MEICMRCNRKLKDPLSVKLGIGPKCRKKIGVNLEVLKEIREKGLDGVPVPGGVQLMIPDTPEERGQKE